jgi:hypothetical protein
MSNLEMIGVKVKNSPKSKSQAPNASNLDAGMRNMLMNETMSTIKSSPRAAPNTKSTMNQTFTSNFMQKNSPKRGQSNFSNIMQDAYDINLERYSLEGSDMGSSRLEMRS